MSAAGSAAAAPPSLAPSAPSAPSLASAVADRGEVHLGEPFHVTVEVRHAPEQRYVLATSQAPGPFAILGGECLTRAASRVGALDADTRCEVNLALLDLGRHAAVLRLEPGGAGAGAVIEVTATSVQALPVTSPSLPASAIALRGMPQPVPLYVPTWAPLLWIAAFVAVMLAFAVLVVRRVRERLRAAEERRRAEPRVLTPSEALEERLDALAAAAPAGGPAPPLDAFFALSAALREYLAELSPGADLARTTGELLAALRRRPVGGLDLGRFAALTGELDAVKYGGADAARERWERVLAGARGVLDATRPPRWHPDREARRA